MLAPRHRVAAASAAAARGRPGQAPPLVPAPRPCRRPRRAPPPPAVAPAAAAAAAAAAVLLLASGAPGGAQRLPEGLPPGAAAPAPPPRGMPRLPTPPGLAPAPPLAPLPVPEQRAPPLGPGGAGDEPGTGLLARFRARQARQARWRDALLAAAFAEGGAAPVALAEPPALPPLGDAPPPPALALGHGQAAAGPRRRPAALAAAAVEAARGAPAAQQEPLPPAPAPTAAPAPGGSGDDAEAGRSSERGPGAQRPGPRIPGPPGAPAPSLPQRSAALAQLTDAASRLVDALARLLALALRAAVAVTAEVVKLAVRLLVWAVDAAGQAASRRVQAAREHGAAALAGAAAGGGAAGEAGGGLRAGAARLASADRPDARRAPPLLPQPDSRSRSAGGRNQQPARRQPRGARPGRAARGRCSNRRRRVAHEPAAGRMIDLTSPSDDEPTGAPPAGQPALTALTASGGKPAPVQRLTSKKAVAPPPVPPAAAGKENGSASDDDADAWRMEPLQRRVRRAVAEGSPEHSGGPAAAAAPRAKRRRSSAAAAAEGDGGSSDFEPGTAAAPEPAKRVRVSAGARAAAKAADKARRDAERAAAKAAKADAKAAARAAKRFEAFAARKARGGLHELEVVLQLDQATAGGAFGTALAAELERSRRTPWQVVPSLPLSGRWPGCACLAFRRRRLCEADEAAAKTAGTARLEAFEEDGAAAPPFVQLVFEQPGPFLDELARDRLAGVVAAVGAAHPQGVTLGVAVLGLRGHVRRAEEQAGRQGGSAAWDWRRVQAALLELHLATPGLLLRELDGAAEAAAHVVHSARAIAQQPYSQESLLGALAGSGPGAASKAAAAAMAADLGAARCSFAVNTLGRITGAGSNRAWAVAKAHPSLGAVMQAFDRAAADPCGPAPELLLADLTEPAAPGRARPRRVGPALSRRLHLLLTSDDPDAIVEGGDADEAD
ncbi:hypothetical protein HT031_001252 [Scenedesmus sp. PABB004]|nr:hypothetical protein HT031_001252 [Scenedesmus sp. PABB004]